MESNFDFVGGAGKDRGEAFKLFEKNQFKSGHSNSGYH